MSDERSIAKRMTRGEEFYLRGGSPRITRAQIAVIEKRFGMLQIESVNGAESGSPRVVYPLHMQSFRAAIAASEPKP